MIRCALCDWIFDSDADPDCFVVGNPSGVFCKGCRDQAEREPRRMPRDWQPTAEQQAIMDKAESEADPDEDPTP